MEPVYVLARNAVLPLMRVWFRWQIIGLEKIPARGPAIIAANHISYFDPLCHAFLVDKAKRRPRFFAKAELWNNRFLGWVFKHSGMIPVQRGTGESGPIDKAESALRRGEVVVLYPEATISHNDDLTPMQGKTGVARLALATGARVYPVAVWGSHWVMPKHRRPSFRPRQTISMAVGDPLTFAQFVGRADDADVRREVTDAVVAQLDVLVRSLHKVHPRGSAVPARIDPAPTDPTASALQ